MSVIMHETIRHTSGQAFDPVEFRVRLRHGNGLSNPKRYAVAEIRPADSDDVEDFEEIFRFERANSFLQTKQLMERAFQALRRWENNDDSSLGDWMHESLNYNDGERIDPQNYDDLFVVFVQGYDRVAITVPAENESHAVELLEKEYGDDLTEIIDVVNSNTYAENYAEYQNGNKPDPDKLSHPPR